MSDNAQFEKRNRYAISRMAGDDALSDLSHQWIERASMHEYSYHFTWLGRPIIQFPQDIVALQELIWQVGPDLIIETGIARGGSITFLASMLELLGGDGLAIGVDIDIRSHNREALEAHPLYDRMHLIEGSSISPTVIDAVRNVATDRSRILVILDSNHTHDHVLEELHLYSPLVGAGSYLIVMDTIIEDMPGSFSAERPWGPGNNPKTAVHEFLLTTDRFEIDQEIHGKLQLTVAPDGYLRCISDQPS